MSLQGLQIVSFESRRAGLVVELVHQRGGACFNAPSVVERPSHRDHQCLRFIRQLIGGEYDTVVFTTGAGVQYLIDAASIAGFGEPFLEALRRTATVSRGPKPAAVLRQHQVGVSLHVPEPNTWREMAEEMRCLPGRSVAVQEYGVSNPEFLDRLRTRELEVTPVTIYRWELPADTAPLEAAVRRLTADEFDIALFLSSVQLTHLLIIGDRLGLRDRIIAILRDRTVVASIGPVMTDALAKAGLTPDFEPKHPKLAPCIRELAERAPALVAAKRRAIR